MAILKHNEQLLESMAKVVGCYKPEGNSAPWMSRAGLHALDIDTQSVECTAAKWVSTNHFGIALHKLMSAFADLQHTPCYACICFFWSSSVLLSTALFSTLLLAHCAAGSWAADGSSSHVYL